MILKGKGGIQYNLEATPFAQGGEGQIFNINGHPDKVAKLYKTGKITPDHERKLLKMVITPPEQDVLDQIAWPLDVLYDNNKFVGFIMRKFKLNEDLNVIYEYGSSAKYPEMTWGNKIRIAKNLCVVLNAVHEAGHVCGDFNPKNISVDPNTGHITFVDTDSYHITDGSNTYRCNVGMPEYLPVEIQKKMHNGLSNAALPTFSQATDNFALAVHIFQLLMNGVHPFACAVIPSQDSVPIPDTSDSILKGECPFFKDVRGKQIPKFAPPADILPQEIKKLFLLAFVEGHASPAARPSAETWYYALEKLEKNLKKCKDVGHHEYHNGLSSCPWCAADKRFSGALSSAKSKGLKQSNFTPPVAPPTRSPSYTPSYASVSSTRGSSSPSYVGANNYGSASNYKKGGFTKKLISSIITIALLAALVYFLIWPKIIYPNLACDDLHTPEIVQSYCYSYNERDEILTITQCTPDGQVTATWEIIEEGKYGKVNLTGQIVKKKNSGKTVIEWTSNSVEMMPEDISWTDQTKATIKKKFTILQADSIKFNAGSNDEYTIDSADDFKKLSGSSGTYHLKNDIDLAGVSWTPIEGFSGMLLGNGHTIKNLKIESSGSNVGFFSNLKGIVKNLNFENAQINVSGRNENVGILCGKLENGNVSDIFVFGSVSADTCTNVGGIIGNAAMDQDCIINNLKNSAEVTGLNNVGGVIGGSICDGGYTTSSASRTISLSNLENTTAIKGNDSYVGGIVGLFYQDGYLCTVALNATSLKNTGDVVGKGSVGGIFGSAITDSNGSIVQDCTNASAITGEYMVGCIAGEAKNTSINNCSNAGSELNVTGHLTEDGVKYAYVGGYVGYGYVVQDCTNEVAINYTGGGRYVGGVIGYTHLQASWKMNNLKNNADITGNSYVGGILGGSICDSTGSTANRTIELSNFENTATITGSGDYVGGIVGGFYQDGYLSTVALNATSLKNTGDVSGKTCVGGIFGSTVTDSNGSIVQDCTNVSAITGESYVGCIAGEAKNTSINNCSNAGSELNATRYTTIDSVKYAYVGGYVGYGYVVQDCTNEVTINYTGGGRYVGGVMGYTHLQASWKMSNLKNNADITGNSYVGGIIGGSLCDSTGSTANRTIELSNFENTASIKGKGNYVGGIVGYFYHNGYLSTVTLYASDLNNSGSVSGSSYVGGIFGYAKTDSTNSTIMDSSSTSNGIAGKLENIAVK